MNRNASPIGEEDAPSALMLRTVKPPPHEVGGFSWLEVVLDLTAGYWLLSGLLVELISVNMSGD